MLMLIVEIFALIGIAGMIGRIAFDKRLNRWPYILLTVVLWFGLEYVGMWIALWLTEKTLMATVGGVIGAASGAIISYLIIKTTKPKDPTDYRPLDSNLK